MERAAGSAGKDRLHQGGGGPRKGHSWEGTPPPRDPRITRKNKERDKDPLRVFVQAAKDCVPSSSALGRVVWQGDWGQAAPTALQD